MGLNSVPSSERVHIGFFGKVNAGKSSLVNAVTGQDMSVVSAVRGTTTDPVRKTMELLPLGPVVVIDTAGYDDDGELGALRTEKTMSVLCKTDIAVLVVEADSGLSDVDRQMISLFKKKNIKYIIVYNKSDLTSQKKEIEKNEIFVSALNRTNINELKELIASLNDETSQKRFLVGDIVNSGDNVILVMPIDSSAPKGRLILPQQQVIRELLETGAVITAVKETELPDAFESLKNKPDLVITDSQVFKKVSALTPEDVRLTSFSILFARYKGVLKEAVKGAATTDKLNDGDMVLISEGCTHHRQCEDIGTVKLPKWLCEYTGKKLKFDFTSGGTFPEDLSMYKLVIHCGGCMLNEREIAERYKHAESSGIKITNYGIVIAHMNKILERSIKPFPDILSEMQ